MNNVTLALPVGFQLDQFRIESVLGKGGFGITYIATDLRLQKSVAVKELMPDSIVTRVEGTTVVVHSHDSLESWDWARKRFISEARTLASFSHPAIVGVHHFLEANGTAYMVMDFVDGESYEARLRRIGREPDEGSLMAVIGPIMDGLAEVHTKGLLHRDIKPDNIMINRRNEPILIDFGAAREVVSTPVSVQLITHGYSPFEQYQSNATLLPSSDIYAIGAVMCRGASGEKPPVATERVMEDPFIPLATRNLPGFSIGFLDCIDRALSVRADSRQQSIEEFKADIQGRQGTIRLEPKTSPAIPANAPPPIPSQTQPAKKTVPAALLAAGIVILLLGAGFFGVVFFTKKNQPDNSISSSEKASLNKTPNDFLPDANSQDLPPVNQNPFTPRGQDNPSASQDDFLKKEKLFQAKQNIKAGYNAFYSIEDRNLIIARLSPMVANSKNQSTREAAQRDITQHSAQLIIDDNLLQRTIQTIKSLQHTDPHIVELAWLEFKNEANLSLASASPDEMEFSEGILVAFAEKIGYPYP